LDQSGTVRLDPPAPLAAPPIDCSAAELLENRSPGISMMLEHFPQSRGVDALMTGHKYGKQADHLAAAGTFKPLDGKIT